MSSFHKNAGLICQISIYMENGDHWIFSRVAFRSCREKRVYQIIQKFKTHPTVKQIKSNEIFEWRRNLKYQSLLWVIWQKSAWKDIFVKQTGFTYAKLIDYIGYSFEVDLFPYSLKLANVKPINKKDEPALSEFCTHSRK